MGNKNSTNRKKALDDLEAAYSSDQSNSNDANDGEAGYSDLLNPNDSDAFATNTRRYYVNDSFEPGESPEYSQYGDQYVDSVPNYPEYEEEDYPEGQSLQEGPIEEGYSDNPGDVELRDVLFSLSQCKLSEGAREHLNELSDCDQIPDNLKDLQFDRKSILHHVVNFLDLIDLQICLANGLDPWIKNEDDGKLALHVALENGDYKKSLVLLEYVENGKPLRRRDNSLKILSLSLLQKTLSNYIGIEKRYDDVDHNLCMKALLGNKVILDGLPSKRKDENKVNASKLVTAHHDIECSRMVQEKASNFDFRSVSGEAPSSPSTLEDALRNDERDQLEMFLLQFGFNTHLYLRIIPDKSKRTIFHLAVKYSSVNCLRYLLKRNRDPELLDIPDKYGWTPLSYASYKYDNENDQHSLLEMISMLIDAKAWKTSKDNNGEPADLPMIETHYSLDSFEHIDELVSLSLAGDFENLEDAENLISELKISYPIRKYAGSKTLLFRCVEKLTLKSVKILLSMGHDPWLRNSDDNQLPLHAALERGHLEITMLLLHHMKLRIGNQVLDFRHSTFSLLQKVICNSKLIEKCSAEINHRKCLEILCKTNVNLNLQQMFKKRYTIFHIIDYIPDEEIKKLFADKKNGTAEIKMSESENLTWIEAAKILKSDDTEELEIFLALCRNKIDRIIRPTDLPNKGTLLHGAVHLKALNCVKFLCRRLNEEEINFPDVYGRTALHLVIHDGMQNGFSPIYVTILKILIQHGAFLFARVLNGDTPHHILAREYTKRNIPDEVLLNLSKILQNNFNAKTSINLMNLSANNIFENYFNNKSDKDETRRKLDDVYRESMNADSEDLRRDIVDKIIEGNYKEAEETLKTLISDGKSMNLNIYIGSHTLLYYIVCFFSYEHLEQMVKCNKLVNPWLPSIKFKVLPLHAALEKGYFDSVKLLIDLMEKTSNLSFNNDLELGYSLLQKVICNSKFEDYLNPRVDYSQSLKYLLESSLIVDVEKKISYLNSKNVLELATMCENPNMAEILQQYGASNKNERSISDIQSLQWSNLVTILKEDDRGSLEYEMSKVRLNPNYISGLSSKRTMLHEAFKLDADNCLEFLIKCVSLNSNINEPDEKGNTILHLIAGNCSFHCEMKTREVLTTLMNTKIDVNARNNEGNTALHKLTLSDHANYKIASDKGIMLRKLARSDTDLEAMNENLQIPTDCPFKKGINNLGEYLNYQTKELSYNDSNEKEMSHLYDALSFGDPGKVKMKFEDIFQKQKSCLLERFFGSKSLLYHLVKYLDVEHIQDLLDAGENPWLKNKDNGQFALHAAVYRGHLPIVHLLIERMKLRDGFQILNLKNHTSEILQGLISNFDTRCVEKNSYNIDFIGCVKRLVKSDVGLDKYVGIKHKISPLSLTTNLNFKEAADILRENGFTSHIGNTVGDNISEQLDDSEREKRLENVLKNDDLSNLQIMMYNSNFQFKEIFHIFGKKTILHYAIEHKARNCFEFLIRKSPATFFLNTPDNEGNTPLHIAVSNCIDKAHIFDFWCVRILLQYGAYVNVRDENGDTPLHIIADKSRYAENKKEYLKWYPMCIDILFESTDIDVNALNTLLETPFTKIIDSLSGEKEVSLKVTKKLIEAGANVVDQLWQTKLRGLDLGENSFEVNGMTNSSFADFYNSIMNGKQISSNYDEDILNFFIDIRYIGAKSLLFYLIGERKYKNLSEFILESNEIDPWTENKDEIKLPLHAALAQGDYNLVSTLLDLMEGSSAGKLDLRRYSFSLIQTILCNMNMIEINARHSFKDCLSLIINRCKIDINEMNKSGNCSINNLDHWIDDIEVNEILGNQFQFDRSNIDDGMQNDDDIPWEKITDILNEDLHEDLEILLMQYSSQLSRILCDSNLEDKSTIFHVAVKFCSKNCLKFLLRKATPREVNRPDKFGRTPLHEACLQIADNKKTSSLSCLMLLVDHGALVNARDNEGNTALHILADLVNREKLENGTALIICTQALLRNNFIIHNAQNIYRQTPYEVASLNINKTQSAEHFLRLLNTPSIKSQNDVEQEKNIEKIIECLLLLSWDKVYFKNELKNHVKLLEKQKRFNIEDRYIGTKSLLYVIAENFYDDNEFFTQFLNKLNPWVRNVDDNRIPLHCAICKNNQEIFISLIKRMKPTRDNSEYLPDELYFSLNQTIDCYSPTNIQIFKNKLVNIFKKDSRIFRYQPNMGKGKKMDEIMKMDSRQELELKIKKSDGNLQRIFRDPDTKKTLLHLAVKHGAVECLKAIIEKLLIKKTQTNRSLLDSPDMDGQTALHFSVQICAYSRDGGIAKKLQCFQILLMHGAYINARDKYGETPLHNIIHLSNIKSSKLLNEHVVNNIKDLLLAQGGIDLEAVNLNLQTPVYLAHLNNTPVSIKKNDENKKKSKSKNDINTFFNSLTRDDFKSDLSIPKNLSSQYYGTKSIFYKVIERKNREAIDEMIRLQMNPWIENVDDGKLPLHAALQNGMADVTQSLLKLMKEKIKDNPQGVQGKSFSLLQTLICNSQAKKNVGDRNRCFQLLVDCSEDINLNLNDSFEKDADITAKSLAACTHLKKLNEAFESEDSHEALEDIKSQDRISFNDVIEIMKNDNRQLLEIECTRRENRILELIHRPGDPEKKTIFHVAVENNALNCLNFLISNITTDLKTAINEPDSKGNSPLHCAVTLQQEESLLLPCLRSNNISGESEKSFSIHFQYAPKLVDILLKAGCFANCRDNKGNSPLHSLVLQCKNSDPLKLDILMKCMDSLIEIEDTDIDAINNEGKAPIDLIKDFALDNSNRISKVVQKLYDKGAKCSTDLKSSLSLNSKKTPEKREERKEFSKVLHLIIFKDEPAIKKYFKNYSRTSMRSWDDEFICDKYFLFYLIKHFDKEIVESALCFGSNPWKEDTQGRIPLREALDKGDYQIVNLLIEYMKQHNSLSKLSLVKFPIKDAVGQKKLQESKEIDFHRCLQRIMEDDVEISDEDVAVRKTEIDFALRKARKENDTQAIKILLKNTEPIRWDDIKKILDEEDMETLESKYAEIGCLQNMMRPDGSPNSWTILHASYEHKKKKIFKRLLDFFSNEKAKSPWLLNEPDDSGETILHKAVSNLDHRTAERLLEEGADVNVRNDYGNTALHLLAKPDERYSNNLTNNWEYTVNVLKKFNIDSQSKNAKDQTAYDVDAVTGNKLKGLNVDGDKPRHIISKISDNLLKQDHYYLLATIDELKESKEKINSQYVGSKTILHHMINLGDEINSPFDVVKRLMDNGCDPWQTNVDGTLPLKRALEIGNLEILKVLLHGMKDKKNKGYVDITKYSSEYLVTLLTIENNSPQRVDCLERLLDSDILIDVNAQDQEDRSPLEIAAILNNQDATKLLLTRGAYIGAKRNLSNNAELEVLDAISAESVEAAAENCITVKESKNYNSTDVMHNEFSLEVNYRFLLKPPKAQNSDKKDKNLSSYQVAETMLELSNDPQHQNALMLPLFEALLESKWQTIRSFIYFSYSVTAVYLSLLIVQCVLLNLNFDRSDETMNSITFAITIVLSIMVFLLASRAVSEMFTGIKSYFKRIESYLEWFLMISSVIICHYEDIGSVSFIHLSAWVTLTAFYEILLSSEHIFEGDYIGKLRFTVRNISRYFLWFSVPMVGFSISLWFLYSEEQPSSFSLHIAKVFAMATADFDDYLGNAAWESDSAVSFSFLMYFFMFFVFVILAQMILITAMTISDVGQFTQEVQYHRKRSKWKVVLRYEQTVAAIVSFRNQLRKSFITKLIDRIVRKHQLPNDKKPTLLLRLNEKDKNRRMILSDGVHEYYFQLNEKLADEFRTLYLKNLDAQKEEKQQVE